MITKIKYLIFALLLLFSFNAKAINVSDVDFVYFLQTEIENCVKNLKAITGDKNKHNLFLNECTRIVANSNKLGKVEFLYKQSNSSGVQRTIEECSEFLAPRDFIECIYQ